MLRTKVAKGVLGLSAVAALLAAVAVHAQTTGGTATTQAGMPSGSQPGMQGGQGGTQAGATASGQGTASAAKLNRADRKIIMTMAENNLAEIKMSRLAQEKSQNEQVKNFAQQMIDDHTKALNEVQQVAEAKNVSLPTEPNRIQRMRADKLAALSGDAFDQAYMAQAGVSAHKKSHAHLVGAHVRARDPDVRALAARTLPVVDQHLNAAQQLYKQTARGASGTQGTTGASPDRSMQNEQNQQNQQQPQQQR